MFDVEFDQFWGNAALRKGLLAVTVWRPLCPVRFLTEGADLQYRLSKTLSKSWLDLDGQFSG